MMINKKVLLSIGLIAVTLTAAGAATFAYFTATRTTSQNQFVAGTLDLDVSANGNKLEPFVVTNMGTTGVIGGEKTWTVKNTGSLPGRLLVRLQNVVNKDNGCNDQEAAVEPNCTADDLGELGGVINLQVGLDGVDKVSSTLATDQQSKVGTDWAALTPIILAAGETRTVTVHWSTGENGYGNEVQSDSVAFDANFRLIQNITGTVTN